MTSVEPSPPLTDQAIQSARETAALKTELIDSTVPGLRLRITKTGGTWYLLTRGLDGERQRLNLGGWPQMKAAAAQDRATALRRRVEEASGPLTIEELIDEYELFKSPALKRGAQTVRAIRDILEPLKLRYPATLSPRDIAHPVRMKSLTAPSSANRGLAYVKAMFSWAKSQGLIDVNPAANLPKPARERPRERTPTLEEIAVIWAAADRRPQPYSQIVQLLILTGCRLQEVAEMRLEELEIRDGEVGEVWTLPAHRTKNGRSIRIPLSPAARSVIDEVLYQNGDWVFASRGDLPFRGWSRAKAGLNAEILREDYPVGPWKLHDLRRAFATYACDELGVRIEVVDRCLNHVGTASTSAVSRVYARSELFAERKAALEAWGSAVTAAVAARKPKAKPKRMPVEFTDPIFKPIEVIEPVQMLRKRVLAALLEARDQKAARQQAAQNSTLEPNAEVVAVGDPIVADEAASCKAQAEDCPVQEEAEWAAPKYAVRPCLSAGWIEVSSGGHRLRQNHTRHNRTDQRPTGTRGSPRSALSITEVGSHRSADGGRGARLQQPVGGDHRQSRPSPEAVAIRPPHDPPS